MIVPAEIDSRGGMASTALLITRQLAVIFRIRLN